MDVYRDETREILKRFREDRISRSACVDALDCALLAAIPELDPAEFSAVQAILAENYRYLAEIDETKPHPGIGALMDQPETVSGYR
ncbi:MAG TPA: hypothetical protein VGM43_20550 [Bryobacteraceae bacterium]|jgi:hypothetical protein